MQLLPDGILADGARYKVTRIQEHWGPPVRGSLTPTRDTREETYHVLIAAIGEPIFIIGAAGSGYADGEGWHAIIYPAGTYRYKATNNYRFSENGAEKTVRCFALSAESALKYMASSP